MTRRLRARLDAFISAHSPALSAHNITFDLLAVEPVEGMRDRFKEKSPGLRVEAGSGSSMPTLENASVNLIIAAQAFHWFSTREALTEMARVLKPGGFFAPIWNTRDLDEPWIAETEKIIDPLYPDSVPRQQTGKWKDVFEPVSESPFALVSSREWKNAVVQTGSIDMILARIFSISVVAADTPENQAALKAKILDVVANHPDTRGKTEFTIPYKTDAYLYQKSCIVQ
jgi:ubiquinone/menaquinone biosynthesis C-methylase UbiE